MNTKCAICLKLDLKARQLIDEALLNGLPNKDIQEHFPEISHITLSRHKRHMGQEKNEIDVTAQRLAREYANTRMSNYKPSEFIVSVRERLEALIEDSITLAEDYTAQCLDKKSIKFHEDLRKDSIASLKNLLSSLESVSGLKQLVDFNSVFTTVNTTAYDVDDSDIAGGQPYLTPNLE